MADISFDPATAALVAIDLQHGIVNLETAPHRSADVVDRTARIAKACGARAGPPSSCASPTGKTGVTR